MRCYFYVSLLIFLNIFSISVQQIFYYCINDLSIENPCISDELNITTKLDEKNGQVDLQFNTKCNTNNYIVSLYYKIIKNENECFTQNASRGVSTHSKYTFTKLLPNETDVENDGYISKCTKTANITFQYVYTGCYFISITDENNNILDYKYVFWNTSYVKQYVDVENTTMINQSRNGNEMILRIENPILNTHPNIELRFYCKNCTKPMDGSKSYVLQQNENDATKLELNFEPTIEDLNISCSLQQNKTNNGIVDCYIFPVTIGMYNVSVYFLGDAIRCSQTNNEWRRPCENHFQQIEVKPVATEFISKSAIITEKLFGPILGVACGLIALLFIFMIIKLIWKHDKLIKNESNIKNCSKNCDETTKTQNAISLLLLYARNSDDIMDTLSCFRNYLISKGFKVHDIYDPEKRNQILNNYMKWFFDLIQDKNLKIIIFLTPNGQNFTKNINISQLKQPVDVVYPFVIQHLLSKTIKDNTDMYKKIFVTFFENDSIDYSEYNNFCPGTRYRVPINNNELIRDITNEHKISFNNKSTNSYNQFKEKFSKIEYLHKC